MSLLMTSPPVITAPDELTSAALLEHTAGLVAVLDMSGFVRYANPALASVYGHPAHEIIGRSAFEMMAPDEVPRVRALLEQALASPGTRITGILRTSIEGGSRWLECVAVNRLYNERIRGFVINAQDVTALVEAAEQLKAQLRETISAFSALIELRDPYTAGHQRRVARLASVVASKLGLSRVDVEGIAVAATLHDIGKFTVPGEILARPGPLSVAERALMQNHSQVGADIVNHLSLPWPVAELILQHHERMDGSGYPQGLRGTEILVGARIIAAADVVEAIASHRPYRPALGIERALEILQAGRGALFDADVVDACIHVFRNTGFRLDD